MKLYCRACGVGLIFDACPRCEFWEFADEARSQRDYNDEGSIWELVFHPDNMEAVQ
jgi:hypothetical protein